MIRMICDYTCECTYVQIYFVTKIHLKHITVSHVVTNFSLKPNPLVIALYCKLVTFGGAALLFWTDIIPGIRMVSRHPSFHIEEHFFVDIKTATT